MTEEYFKGSVEVACDFFEAEIHCRTPQGGSDGVWYSRILLYAETKREAVALQEKIINLLNKEVEDED